MAETVRLAKAAVEQWQALSGRDREDARQALQRLADNPISGAPLFDPLRGFWVAREGAVRIVYRVSRDGSMAGVVLIDTLQEPS
jgi:mRNA-degrading endonuclease RelE of RelBE toxin-antitoxin system